MEKIAVLYVDDNLSLLDIAKIFLERNGMLHLSTLPSATEALEHLKTHRYDVIVSDYQMPGMDGIEFLKKVREQYAGIPFILFTGKGREEVVIEALNSGADSYIQKGGNPTAQFAELHQKIKITVERRQAQTALGESEKKYRQLIENAQEGVYIIQDEKFAYFNPKFIEILEHSGFSKEDFLSQPFYKFIHPDEQDMMRERYQRRIDHNERFPLYPFRFVNKNGGIHWWEVDAIRIEWNDKPATLNFSRDITEQHALKQQVSESESRYKDLVESLPRSVMEFDDKCHLKFINKRGRAKFGYCNEDLAKNICATDLVIPQERKIVGEIYRRLKKGEIIPKHETVALKKDGSTFPMEVYSSPIQRENKINGFRVVCNDISEAKKLNDKLVQTNAKLNLVFQISTHDLRNKLVGLSGYLDLAREKTSDPVTAHYLQEIGNITATIEEQIEFTKMYSEVGILEPQWQNVDEILVQSRQQLPMGTINCRVNSDGLEIYADQLFEKVMYNLFDNTLHHGEHASEINLSFFRADPNLVLVYEDNGVGIPESDKSRVFVRGFGSNTGFGLFLIREILEITGISITETGELGKGVRFEILIPQGKYRFVQKKTEPARILTL